MASPLVYRHNEDVLQAMSPPGVSKHLRSPDSIQRGPDWPALEREYAQFCSVWSSEERARNLKELQANLALAQQQAATRQEYLETQPVQPFCADVDNKIEEDAANTTMSEEESHGGPASSHSSFRGPGQANPPAARVCLKYDEHSRNTWTPVRVVNLPAVNTVPSYKTWAYLSTNEHAVATGYPMFYTDKHNETVPATDSDDEYNDYNRSYMNRPIEGPERAMNEAALLHMAYRFPHCIKQVLDFFELTLEVPMNALKERLQQLTLTKEQPAPREDVDTAIHALAGAFCRRCHVYGCRKHGGDQIKPHAPPKPLPPPAADAQPCGPHCWQNARPLNTQPPLSSNPLASVPTRRRRSSPPSTTTTAWTPLETSMLQKYFTMFGGDCCRLAPFIATKRCWQVHQRTAELKLSASVEQPAQPEKHDAKRRKKRSTMVMATKRPTDPVAYRRLAHAGEKKPFFDYQPCECVGPCTKECPCLQNEHYCEKYCACFGRCTRMWPGCSCIAKEKCRTKNCKCYAYNRECDPDVCKGCGMTCMGTAGHGTECHNMRLRLRQHKRVVMGLSNIPEAGWGAFVLEPLRKGDFIGEYTGELVGNEEAERRGKCYDRDNSSYLFNLNRDWVIDARERGNKLRFANHSSTPNCQAEILMVDGDHRVAIFASRDIEAGEELLYNYGYTGEGAPAWAHPPK